MKYLFKGVALLAALILLTGCAESYQTTVVKGAIVDKEHDEARTYYKKGKNLEGNATKKLVHEPEEFEVTVQYEDIIEEFEFSNDSYYKTVKIGDEIDINLITGIDKNGKIVTKSIDLIDK